jgi:signal transduction histidine kinase
MSLRIRLPLLYTTILAGTLLLFGSLVYGLVSLVLLNQVDNRLEQQANQLISRIQINAADKFDVRLLSLYQSEDGLSYELWDTNGRLLFSRPPGYTGPISGQELLRTESSYATVATPEAHLRVLSVPLQSERGRVGLLQIAVDLMFVDLALEALTSVLVTVSIIGVIFSAMAAWFVTDQSLAPLGTVTDTAVQITRADDLQRRIPLPENASKEIRELIVAFNQTLERMARLFDVQRRFLQDVSHELRTPLTVIKINVDLMEKMNKADPESLNAIESEVSRMTRLVNNLLLLAKAESGDVPFENQVFDLDTVVLEVYRQMKVVAGEKIKLKLGEMDQIQIMGDRDRIKQVIMNLVGNGIQYTPEGGQVTLALQKSEHFAQIIVNDTGSGMSEEELQHIFERFYRGEKSRKRGKNTGFGLGLSISNWIVKNHNGLIEVTSQKDKGTTFVVKLPLMKEEAATSLEPPSK